MTPPRRAKLVLLVLAVAIVGLGVWAREPVWWWVMTERIVHEVSEDEKLPVGSNAVFSLNDDTRGWLRVNRWSGRLEKAKAYYRDTDSK